MLSAWAEKRDLPTPPPIIDGSPKAQGWSGRPKSVDNHPCTLWLEESEANVWWLLCHMAALLAQFDIRYPNPREFKFLKPRNILEHLKEFVKPSPFESITTPVLCMPDMYKQKDPVASYRAYYIAEKIQGKHWLTEVPDWILPHLKPIESKNKIDLSDIFVPVKPGNFVTPSVKKVTSAKDIDFGL